MSRIGRNAALVYGAVCYALFFATFLYLIAFVADLAVPRPIDTGAAGDPAARPPRSTSRCSPSSALQHSVMARPGFKARLDPLRAAADRAQHLRAREQRRADRCSSRSGSPSAPRSGTWRAPLARRCSRPAAFLGVGTVLYSTFLIDHFDLFGLRQVVLAFAAARYTEKRFVDAAASTASSATRSTWAGSSLLVRRPTLTAGHLLFAAR